MMGREYPPGSFPTTAPHSAIKLVLGIVLLLALFFLISSVYHRIVYPDPRKALEKEKGREN
jgi:hypothetical protein